MLPEKTIHDMKKYLKDMVITQVEFLRDDYVLLSLSDPSGEMPECLPGQFVQLAVEGEPKVMLRRPISINWCDAGTNRLDLLIHLVGPGTRALARLRQGDTLSTLFPLGNGFTIHTAGDILLVGGGVGTAPMLQYGKALLKAGARPHFLLGGRSAKDILQLERFRELCEVSVTTEDATLGERGFVTQHSILGAKHFDAAAACGPKPMMRAVALWARQAGVPCEVSLENMMACGLGACLCCVEKTVRGNVCVCTEGPVFPTTELTWF